MIENSKAAEDAAVLNVARQMCAAARTAPKACGIDHLSTCIVTDEDKGKLADEMERISKEKNLPFFGRDAGNVRASQAVVLIGCIDEPRGLNESCKLCKRKNCAENELDKGVCVFDPMDLGIALGSAVSIAADNRLDNRIMFTAGQAAIALKIFPEEVKIAMGIPLSATRKSPYFDRK
ncbi:MAG: DUF2148 domain-containing protein [Eubacteriales bacterium]